MVLVYQGLLTSCSYPSAEWSHSHTWCHSVTSLAEPMGSSEIIFTNCAQKCYLFVNLHYEPCEGLGDCLEHVRRFAALRHPWAWGIQARHHCSCDCIQVSGVERFNKILWLSWEKVKNSLMATMWSQYLFLKSLFPRLGEFPLNVPLVTYPVSCSMTKRTATVVQLNMSWTTAQAKARPKLSLSPIWPTLTRVLVIDVPVVYRFNDLWSL